MIPGILTWNLAGAPGIGTARERALWALGGYTREGLPHALSQLGIAPTRVMEFVERWDAALAACDVPWLHAALPTRERWRVLPLVLEKSVSLDVETAPLDGAQRITVMTLRTPSAATVWVDAGAVPPQWELMERAQVLLTFNGSSFDVPLLKQHWPQVTTPPFHVDLMALCRRLKITGGLKALERHAGWIRAPHIEKLRGNDAVGLWQRWQAGDRSALALVVEYNMEDVWSLPYLAAYAHDALCVRQSRGAVHAGAPEPGPLRAFWQERAQSGPMMLGAVAAALEHTFSQIPKASPLGR